MREVGGNESQNTGTRNGIRNGNLNIVYKYFFSNYIHMYVAKGDFLHKKFIKCYKKNVIISDNKTQLSK